MTTYKYKSLDMSTGGIRILTLHPGSPSDKLHIRIHHERFTATEVPTYEALSYTWGAQDKATKITVGINGSLVLSVNQNLGIALSHLRYPERPRALWIDALCIDQSNLEERGSQVKRMGEIYKRAERVVAWLGPEDNDSAYAMELLGALASKVEVDWDTLVIKSSLLGASEAHWADRYVNLPYAKRECAAINYLIHRSWFERLWIRQEIALSKPNAIVVCGVTVISWQEFRKAVAMIFLKTLPVFPSSGERKQFKKRCDEIIALGRYHPKVPAWATLRSAGFCDCFDQRDRVYGMLGLVKEAEGDMKIEPDYSLSTSEVYISLVLSLLDFHKRLDVLLCCEIPVKLGELPTWIPNWSIGTKYFSKSSSDALAPASAMQVEKGILRVNGIFAATIKTTNGYRSGYYKDEIWQEISRLAPTDVMVASYHCGGSLLDAFCRTLCGDSFAEARVGNTNLPSWQSSKDALSRIFSSSERRVQAIQDGRSEIHYCNQVRYHAEGRSFFTTEEGYIGLAPKRAIVGDIVCVILGCRSPLVLRNVERAQYQVVGECYMDGVMGGELVLGSMPETYCPKVQLDRADRAWWWLDAETGEYSWRDPRLARLTKDGEDTSYKQIGNSYHYPILTPRRLKEAGVNITSFDLV